MENIACSPWSFSAHEHGAGFGVNLSFFGFRVPNVTNIRIVPEYGMSVNDAVMNGRTVAQPNFEEKWWRMMIEVMVHRDEMVANIPQLHESVKDEVYDRLMARILELEEENRKLRLKGD